jgi:hypothetical protein
MPITCLLGGHNAFPSSVRNQGFMFSRCRCCGRDMIRSRGAWKRVPKGLRVVWRRETPAAAAPGALIRNLPVPRPRVSATGFVHRVSARIELVGTGLRLLLSSLAARLRLSRTRLAETLQPRPRVLRLPAP